MVIEDGLFYENMNFIFARPRGSEVSFIFAEDDEQEVPK